MNQFKKENQNVPLRNRMRAMYFRRTKDMWDNFHQIRSNDYAAKYWTLSYLAVRRMRQFVSFQGRLPK